MRNLSLQFADVRVLISLKKGDLLCVTVDGKQYFMTYKAGPAFIEKPDDLSEALQERIMWAVGNYFTRKD